MTKFDEVRPFEGLDTPIAARHELRQMFKRWLWRSHHARFVLEHEEVIDELCLLELSQHYRLEYSGATENSIKVWNESKQRVANGDSTFEDLVHMGWVNFDGARWVMPGVPLGTLAMIAFPSLNTKAFLTGFSKINLVEKTGNVPLEAQALASQILTKGWLDGHIPTKDPEWLAGRLWERLCPKPLPHATIDGQNTAQAEISVTIEPNGVSEFPEAETSAIDRAFLEWSAWCKVLGCGAKWSIGWSAIEKQYCREAAHRVLKRQTLWGTWDDDVARYTDVLEKTYAISPDKLRFANTPRQVAPSSLVVRKKWLSLPEVEHLIMGRLGWSTVEFAFALLNSELEETDIGSGVMDTATNVISFANDHPMALQHLLLKVSAVPALMVDMLLNPRTACLAVRLIIEWQHEGNRHSDRVVSREAQVKAFAIHDALSILAHQLNRETLDLDECAALITWCYADTTNNKVTADSNRLVARQILGMFVRRSDEIQSALLKKLVDQAAYKGNVSQAIFAGVLNGLDCLSKVPNTLAFPIVALYTKFAGDMQLDWTDVSSLSAKLAARLVAISFGQTASDRDALLVPFDSANLLRAAPDEQKPSLRSSIARTLRSHVRLLARAVAGWPDSSIPTELYEALLTLISRSVIDHTEKGRVGALTDRYSPILIFAQEDGSPAQDIAAAWRRLSEGHQDALLQALAVSDDPVLLAEICQHLPSAAKSSIRARLRQLKPEEASELWTWPELQHRIQSLVAAGEYGLAREHLNEAVHGLASAPQEFQLAIFGLELQLLMAEKNWVAVEDAVVPSTLNEITARQALNLLDFYKATSQLLRPDGNLKIARSILQRLAAVPGAPSAYKENVYAVAIREILGPTLQPLTDEGKVIGESLLAEINADVAVNEKLARSSLLANRALLLLALERPEEALESVAARRRGQRSLDLELIAIHAKSKMGFQSEAMAILNSAIDEFGLNDQLIAAKEELETGQILPSVASVSNAGDTILSIRAALQQLTELLPSQVGDLLGPPGDKLQGYLTRIVSRALAALQHMAAMLRNRKDQKNEAKFENDLNTAVREVLTGYLNVVKWNVADQSLGGSTSNGNPGERDAVIRVSGHEISIYEALVCSNLDKAYTKKHFDKLLSYGVCDIYFHVTYSYAEKIETLLNYVRQMLEYEAPAGLKYQKCELLGPPDHETCGYIATYSAGHRDVTVVFFIVDLKVRKQLSC